MDAVIITAAVILAVIALIEIVTLFCGIPSGGANPSYIAVLPIFAEDTDFPERLERLALRSGGRSRIILLNCNANNSQLELCRQFLRDNPDAVLVAGSELEEYLSEAFALQNKK